MNLFHREKGAGNNSLIILHGLYGCSDNWLQIANKVSKELKVFMPDARNHGRSEWSNTHNYKVMAEDLKSFIDENSITSPIIAGHSMGGKTAIEFASIYPDIISKLIVIDISPGKYHFSPDNNTISHEEILSTLNNIDLSKYNNISDTFEDLKFKLKNERLSRFMMKNIYNKDSQLNWKININTLRNELESIMDEVPSNRKKVETETLILKAQNSNYIKAGSYKELLKTFNNFTIKEIPDSGHWVHVDNPIKTTNEILNYARK